jgi:hypothetical protein
MCAVSTVKAATWPAVSSKPMAVPGGWLAVRRIAADRGGQILTDRRTGVPVGAEHQRVQPSLHVARRTADHGQQAAQVLVQGLRQGLCERAILGAPEPERDLGLNQGEPAAIGLDGNIVEREPGLRADPYSRPGK